MTRPMGTATAVFVSVVLLSSCAPKRAEVSLDPAAVPASKLITLMEDRERNLQSIVGKGIVSFESPELSGNAAFQLALKRPDSLLVTFEGPFGIDLGTLFLSRGHYVMYNSMENTVSRGVPSARAIRSVIPFDLTYDELMNVFSGFFAFPSAGEEPLSYGVDGDEFVLSYRQGEAIATYWVDPRYLRVTKYEVSNGRNELLVQARSSTFSENGDASAPRRISVRFPTNQRSVSLYYSSISLNDPHPSFVFSIPDNAHDLRQ